MQANVNQKSNVMASIEKAMPAQIPAIPEVAERFKKLYGVIHPGAKAEIFYEAEKFHFMKLIRESNALQECTKFSLYGCFLDVAVNGLSFDPSFKHLYIVPYNINVGTKESKKWEKRASLQISGQGELLLRKLQGQIKYADNPVLVYEGDEFSFGVKNEKAFINHTSNIPRKNNVIIACYMKITRNDGSIDYKIITQDDINRFRKFSKEPESKAWVDGIGGMWMAKCIKHAFKNYPKVRTGDFSNLESDTVDTEVEVTANIVKEEPKMVMPEAIDYGMENGSGPANGSAPIDDEEFTQSTVQTGNTVTVNDDEF